MIYFIPGQTIYWIPAGASTVTPRKVPAIVLKCGPKRVQIQIITPEGPGMIKHVGYGQILPRDYDPTIDMVSPEELEIYAVKKYGLR